VLHELQTEFGKAIIIACSRPCAFLGPDNLCSIYPTRPNCCVGMQAGDEQCQEARAALGLPPLEPMKEPGET
jgi:Fe-S-cluster containining protein